MEQFPPLHMSAVNALQGYLKMNDAWDICGTLTSLRFTCHRCHCFDIKVHLVVITPCDDASAAAVDVAAVDGGGSSGGSGVVVVDVCMCRIVICPASAQHADTCTSCMSRHCWVILAVKDAALAAFWGIVPWI